METIFIEANYKKSNSKQFTIEALNKHDFDRQISKLLSKKKITKQWGLVGRNSLNHRWFSR